MVLIVEIILIAVALYLVAGIVFAIFFVSRGVTQIDEGAKGSGLVFRILIIPGSAVFWPILLKKWLTIRRKVNH
jgi:hypothetical protein